MELGIKAPFLLRRRTIGRALVGNQGREVGRKLLIQYLLNILNSLGALQIQEPPNLAQPSRRLLGWINYGPGFQMDWR